MNADLRIFRSSVMLGLVAFFVAMASAAHAADVTGTWLMAVKFGEINGTPSFVLSQQGDKVTGTFKGQLGEANVIGAVTGNAIKLSFKTKNQGQDLDVVYSGTVDGDSMSGKVEFVGAGEGTFTGKKK
jgi:hypothetical protein